MNKKLCYHKEVVTADAAEQKSIAELRLQGIERIQAARKGKDSILNGIDFIKQFDIVIDERCFKTIEELENYTWKKDKRSDEYTNVPVDSYNNSIDAIRYALESARVDKKNYKENYKSYI